MKKVILIVVSGALIISLFGCGTMGSIRGNNTNVELSKANFSIIARDLEGTAEQGYLIGLSAPQNGDVGIVGLIKVSGEDKLYDSAVKEVWADFREKIGDPKGRKLALINIRQDVEVLNTIVYTSAKIYITADVVEFVE